MWTPERGASPPVQKKVGFDKLATLLISEVHVSPLFDPRSTLTAHYYEVVEYVECDGKRIHSYHV